MSALVLVLDLPFPFCHFNGFAFSLFLEFPKRTFASRSLPTCLYVCPAHVLDSPSSIFRPAIRRSMLGRATIETRSFESGTALARAWTTCAASFINRTQMMSSRPGGRRFSSDRNSPDCPECLQISSLWNSCQVPSYFTTKWFSKSTGMTLSSAVIHVAGQFEFRSFPVFPDSHTFLTLASHFSIVPASTSSLHLSGDVMVSGNARFHLTTTRSQRLTTFLHAFCTVSRTSSCYLVLRFVTRQSCQRCPRSWSTRLLCRQRRILSPSWSSASRTLLPTSRNRHQSCHGENVPPIDSTSASFEECCRTESLHVHQELLRLAHAIELLRECSYCFDQSCLRSGVVRWFHRRRRCHRSLQSLFLLPAE